MDITAKIDINAPREFTYKSLLDFDAHEKRIAAYGAEIARTKDIEKGDSHHEWSLSVNWRGQNRDLTLRTLDMVPSEVLTLETVSDLFTIHYDFKLISLSPKTSRLRLKTQTKGKSLKARILLQSARLASSRIERDLRSRMQVFGDDVEYDYRRFMIHNS